MSPGFRAQAQGKWQLACAIIVIIMITRMTSQIQSASLTRSARLEIIDSINYDGIELAAY